MIRLAVEWNNLEEKCPATDDVCVFIVVEKGGEILRKMEGYCFGSYIRRLDGEKYSLCDADDIFWCDMRDSLPPEVREFFWNLQRD